MSTMSNSLGIGLMTCFQRGLESGQHLVDHVYLFSKVMAPLGLCLLHYYLQQSNYDQFPWRLFVCKYVYLFLEEQNQSFLANMHV